jgi:triphosphoribosyl-dephospho-CoA synthase
VLALANNGFAPLGSHEMSTATDPTAHARDCFLRACELDVTVRKPGNVSVVSPGHRMHAEQFIASAQATAAVLFDAGAPVGARIERAVAATWTAVGCNTNLGIVLLIAPLAVAAERAGALDSMAALRSALDAVLSALDLADARAAYRAIATANPAGLGHAAEADVRSVPQIGLREAMALAAQRDLIARQYANGFADVFDALHGDVASGFVLARATAADVQRVYLGWLSRHPDSHIVRKHGVAVAHTVMTSAQAWAAHPAPDSAPAFAAWDESLKAAGINPGTSADLTVATLWIAGVLPAWHGS